VKPLLRRAESRRDLEAISDYYEAEAGTDVAARFLEAVRATHEKIGRHPGAGSLRHGREAGIVGLRSRLVPRFPYLIFYIELEDSMEVWRVPHAHSDIPARLR
jgi:toxin ParE1/3/4